MTEAPWERIRTGDAALLAVCRPSAVVGWEAHAREACTPEEWTRAARFRFDRLRRRWLCGRTMLRQLLARLDGGHPAEVRLGATERGRPLALGADRAVSLSYTDDLVVALVGPGPLGVDVERVDRECDAAAIASRAFREEERTRFGALEGDEARDYFFRVWVEKEAAAKALGLGLFVGFEHFDAREGAASLDATLETFYLAPGCLASTVVPRSCPVVLRARWKGDPELCFDAPREGPDGPAPG